jgi:uncharacterized protein
MTLATPPATATLGDIPADPDRRLVALDVLRGAALLGILVMNIQSFSMPDAAYLNPSAYGDLRGANLLVWVLGHLFTDEKMYGIFSMLFGAGILLMTSRLEQGGRSPARVHYRRMGWLMLFGLLHGFLLWPGDILWTYGVAGLVVYLFRKRSPRRLLVAAVIFFAIGSGIFASVGLLVNRLPPDQYEAFEQENWRPTPEMIQDEIAVLRGRWSGQLSSRIENALFMDVGVFLMLFGWKTIGNMLLGMAFFKWGVFTGALAQSDYRLMAVAGFLLGLPVVAFGAWRNFAAGWDGRYSFFFGSQFNYWGAIVVDIGWIGALMLLATSPGFTQLKMRLAVVGRTAFTNYILQTVICTTLFYGQGFGLFGAVSRFGQLTIVVAIWIVQLLLAPVWLRYFQFGPLEWLWRSLTYWRRMPMAVAPVSTN